MISFSQNQEGNIDSNSKKSISNTILFLNENPLPTTFTQGTIAGKELRLRAALSQIDRVVAISLPGQSMHDSTNGRQGTLEKKVHIVRTIPWPYYLSGIILFLYGCRQILKHRPVAIEAESPHISGPAAIALGFMFRIPTVIEYRASYHELINHRFRFIPKKVKRLITNVVLKTTLKSATGVIANSRYYQRLIASWGVPATVINPGVQYIKQMSKKWKRGQKHSYVIGFMGRLVPEKGSILLAHAFIHVSRQLRQFEICLEVAGTGPEKQSCARIFKDAGLSNNVRFLGWMRSSNALSRWDLLINPNLVSHPLEMVNAEAAYCGIPVICFGNRDVPETVVHLQTGYKVKTQTAESLADAIVKILQNPSLRKRLSSNGKKFVHEHFDFNTQVRLLSSFYNDLGIIKSSAKYRQRSH